VIVSRAKARDPFLNRGVLGSIDPGLRREHDFRSTLGETQDRITAVRDGAISGCAVLIG
jgi:hypothetical protein